MASDTGFGVMTDFPPLQDIGFADTVPSSLGEFEVNDPWQQVSAFMAYDPVPDPLNILKVHAPTTTSHRTSVCGTI
jgi:hypothetical protein